jgi:hypothetical protein
MTLREKLDTLNKDIQDCVVVDDNIIIYHPLPGKIKKLSEYLNPDSVEKMEFTSWVNATTKPNLAKSIELCNEAIPKNTRNHRYKDQAVNNIKRFVDDAVWWFKKGCKDTNITILDKEVV